MSDARVTSRPSRMRERLKRITGFHVATLLIALAVSATVFTAFGRLASTSWDTYGTDVFGFYRDSVFGSPAVRRALLNTAIVSTVATTIAVFAGAVLAWLNERTDASIGTAGRVLPLVPFLMPAIALPLGWVFLAAPTAGVLNVLLRTMLGWVGIDRTEGPLNIYSWWGLIFLYSVVLTGFAYLVLASSVRDLDSRIEDAARMSGAGALRVLFRIVLPVLRPAMVNAFFLCMMIALVMVSVPLTVAQTANIPIVSVLIVQLITSQVRPLYADAFLTGLVLLVPILVLWVLQRRSASRRPPSAVGAKAVSPPRLRLGPWRRAVGRAIFLSYVAIAVALPVLGLIYLAGLNFWTSSWPEHWNPLPQLADVLTDRRMRPAMLWSLRLGILAGAALISAAFIMSYGQRLFPRFGAMIDIIVKSPAVVTQILTAVALLMVFAGAPFHLVGTAWILFIGYVVVFLPFASVITTGALQEVGNDVVEASQLSGASDFRTFRRIALPLTWPTLVSGFLLMFVVICGEVNISLMLASSQRPVIGFIMVDLFSFGSMPQVAAFALVVTLMNVVFVTVFMRVLNMKAIRPR